MGVSQTVRMVRMERRKGLQELKEEHLHVEVRRVGIHWQSPERWRVPHFRLHS